LFWQQGLPEDLHPLLQPPAWGLQTVASGPQHSSPQPKAAGPLQQESSAQPLAGGLHVESPHCVTRSAQRLLKQLPEQQSMDWQQTRPFGSPQRWSAQHCWPAGQLFAVQVHCPLAVQDSPGRQVPQFPPQPSGPHVLPVQSGVQTHCPWALHWPLSKQSWQSAPWMPQRGARLA
jgi:hypothetical protein